MSFWEEISKVFSSRGRPSILGDGSSFTKGLSSSTAASSTPAGVAAEAARKQKEGYFGLIIACLVGAAVGLVVLNYRHALYCKNAESHDNTELYLDSLQRRLVIAENDVRETRRKTEKLVRYLSTRFGKLTISQSELDEIYSYAEKTAITAALQKAPQTPVAWVESWDEFAANQEGKGENLEGMYDDFTKYIKEKPGSGSGDDQKKPAKEPSQSGADSGGEGADLGPVHPDDEDPDSFSDTEKLEMCKVWSIEHNVKVGQSWGTLPTELQQDWAAFNCDYFMQKDSFDHSHEMAHEGRPSGAAGSDSGSEGESGGRVTPGPTGIFD
jgi:hypothetical protein